jgi:type IV pilus assembly protein PilY1
MWEFTDADDRDLGYTYSEPAIIRLNDGTWAAVFGNGYNNTVDDGQASFTGNAVLYVVDLADGSLIRKLDTGVGVQQDPASTKRANGLSTITPIDITNNSNTDFIYAGDLHGNLWKFDIRDTNSASWSISNSGSPLFTACTDSNCNQRQPITNKPTVSKHPWGGFMVYFGTGKYLETSDKSADSNQLQSFYAIWDKDSAGVTRNQLLQQVATDMSYSFTTVDNKTNTEDVRLVTNNRPNWAQHRGWYIDLPATRERQVTAPVLRNNKIIFTTLIPVIDSDPCASEADGYLMELDAFTGGRLKYSVFDFTESLSFGEGDKVITGDGSQVVSGRKLDGNLSEPLILADENDPDGIEYKIMGDHVIVENPGTGATGRQNWRQLHLED